MERSFVSISSNCSASIDSSPRKSFGEYCLWWCLQLMNSHHTLIYMLIWSGIAHFVWLSVAQQIGQQGDQHFSMIWDFLFLRCIHAFTDTLVFLPMFAKGSAFLVLSGAACFPLFSMEYWQNFFLDQFDSRWHLLKICTYLWSNDTLQMLWSTLALGILARSDASGAWAWDFKRFRVSRLRDGNPTCFLGKVEIQLLRYGDLQHNSKCPNLEFGPWNGIKFVIKGSKYMGESCCSYWFCSQSYYVLGTSIR